MPAPSGSAWLLTPVAAPTAWVAPDGGLLWTEPPMVPVLSQLVATPAGPVWVPITHPPVQPRPVWGSPGSTTGAGTASARPSPTSRVGQPFRRAFGGRTTGRSAAHSGRNQPQSRRRSRQPQGPFASYELQGPSVPYELQGSSAPYELQGPSAPYMQGPSVPYEMQGPSVPYEMQGPSAPYEMQGPSAPYEMQGPSAPYEMQGPSALYEMQGPSALYEPRGPTSRRVHP
ncbi:hypothetical protein VOLCADRAFT_94951 [Volvox carteri f. nagariensis]|uniref:Uncharacterized protein n=1 Tax=Volvox carteri f. nagariensis TaxID=3068 RepID=D8U675_VOLCA|nr:uncharacterized protein VOLCADRAFT_94951 [Volvox carteri f. nagariensis]EFJ44891.1 hypothetical protein VOLCADRAFT_94951 [Volvox carteri f. nagariensis]|eukprot:XP_002954174.1 hypothetical protein VOLCADRAFT_94951 [Volvox carteri f. nagariensis]